MTRYLSADAVHLVGEPARGVLRIADDGRVDVVPAHAVPHGRLDGHVAGTVIRGLRDSHVHLGIVGIEALAGTQLASVLDLGWVPAAAQQWLRSSALDVRIAGAFLAAPEGYPSRQEWAPAGATRFVLDADDAAVAVREQRVLGATAVKITLNSVAGPVHDDDTLRALVRSCRAAGLVSVVHAEGAGQAARAYAAEAAVLAHTPWTERLDDALLRAMAARMAWISTIDIHARAANDADLARATDNLGRFVAYGGRVLYGTDLGNGALPVGLNGQELDALIGAGLDAHDLLHAVAGIPLQDRFLSVIDGALPTDPRELVHLLLASRPVLAAELGR